MSELDTLLRALAGQSAPHSSDLTHAYATVPEGYKLESLEHLQPIPNRIRATVKAHTLDTFTAYFNRFKNARSVVFADQAAFTLTAVLDYHEEEHKPRWGSHKVVYTAPRSEEWKRWTASDGKVMNQSDFVRFMEENRINIVEPDGATILEVAQTLEAKKNVHFKSGIRLADGNQQLIFTEETESQTKGNLKVPQKFILGIPVFFCGEPYKVEALLRYRIEEGRLRFCYDLHRREYIEQDAFAQVVKAAADGIKRDILMGALG